MAKNLFSWNDAIQRLYPVKESKEKIAVQFIAFAIWSVLFLGFVFACGARY